MVLQLLVIVCGLFIVVQAVWVIWLLVGWLTGGFMGLLLAEVAGVVFWVLLGVWLTG